MSESAQVADQMATEAMQLTEWAVKLAANGMKNLALLLFSLAKRDPKVIGKTNLRKLLHDGKPLKIFQIDAGALPDFQKEAKKYGILYSIIKEKGQTDGLCDIVATAESTGRLNRIFENLGIPLPEGRDGDDLAREGEGKNSKSRAPRDSASKERGTGSTEYEREMMPMSTTDKEPVRTSVGKAMAALSKMRREPQIEPGAPER
jgi:hypothetical protein